MDKSMEVQMQMRRNVEQMHATADDLADFAKEISKRDRSLRGLTNESIAAKEADDGTDAVSYTHLTLPTICSV
eukprot:6424914-Prymnesium_polylepis.2